MEESQLLAKEQILRRQATAALRDQTNEGTEIKAANRDWYPDTWVGTAMDVTSITIKGPSWRTLWR